MYCCWVPSRLPSRLPDWTHMPRATSSGPSSMLLLRKGQRRRNIFARASSTSFISLSSIGAYHSDCAHLPQTQEVPIQYGLQDHPRPQLRRAPPRYAESLLKLKSLPGIDITLLSRLHLLRNQQEAEGHHLTTSSAQSVPAKTPFRIRQTHAATGHLHTILANQGSPAAQER